MTFYFILKLHSIGMYIQTHLRFIYFMIENQRYVPGILISGEMWVYNYP